MNNDTPVGPEVRMRDNMRGARYGEIFVITGHLNHLRGAVYNTLGLNECPQEQWNALDPDQIKQETKARAIVMNGPRYFLMDQATSENLGVVVSTRTSIFGVPWLQPWGGKHGCPQTVFFTHKYNLTYCVKHARLLP
jgi:hypothetical protein